MSKALIASLFPDSSALSETKRKVVPVIGSKAPFQRLMFTPPVIKAAKEICVLVNAVDKKQIYGEALLNPTDIALIPARLVLDRTSILETEHG